MNHEPPFAYLLLLYSTFFFCLVKLIHQSYIHIKKTNLSLDGVLSLGESLLSLLLLEGLSLGVSNRESSSDSSGLLGAQVLGNVLLGLVELTELFSLGEVDDSQDLGNSLSNLVNLGRLDVVARG